MSYEFKIGQLKGEVRDGVFRVVRITARGRKTIAKADVDVEEYAQPEAWFEACESWLNLLGRQGWSLAAAETIGELEVRYVMQRETGAGAGRTKAGKGEKAAKKQRSLTEELTEQVAGKAVKSVLKIP